MQRNYPVFLTISRHLIFNLRYASQLAISLYQAKSRVFVKKYLAFESHSLNSKNFKCYLNRISPQM